VRWALLCLALQADPRAQLKALESRRAAEEAAARLLREREVSLLDTLGEAEQALGMAESEAARAERERARSEKRLEQARADEAAAQARLDRQVRELKPRLAARQRMGRLGELRLLLASASLADLVKRHALVDRILAHDLTSLEEAQASLAQRERARLTRAAETVRIAALAAEAQKRRAEAAARREERRTLLAAIRGAKVLHERAVTEVAGQERKLAEFISALPPAIGSGGPLHTGFADLKGRLPRPADGPVELGFGRVVNPRFNTVTVQKGVDIGAGRGEPVRSVAPGRVAHAGWFKGYGNLVIVDHGDGYHTLVAHLDSMSTAMGEEVNAGTLLGTVGDTGSLKGPYLYFEIRERGRPVDPRAWLAPRAGDILPR
jgi:septal ring factor EnvC (AmiA/AmiB activator)